MRRFKRYPSGRTYPRVAEVGSRYARACPSEEAAAIRWLRRGKSMSGSLKTDAGERIAVLDPGVRNTDSGPDFKEASLIIGGRFTTGDVELHISARGWYEHSHDDDPAYNDVVLHLVVEEVPGIVTLTSRGRRVPTSVMPPFKEQEMRQDLVKGWARGPQCRNETPPERTGELYSILMRLGTRRLAEKRRKFSSLRDEGLSYGEIFYRGLARALGYSKNIEPFERLSSSVPYNTVLELSGARGDENVPSEIEALFFGAANLLETGDEDERRRELGKIWETIRKSTGAEVVQAHEWRFFRLRPANFPTRRLAGFVSFLSRQNPEHFFSSTASAVRRSESAEEAIDRIETSLRVQGTGYWTTMSNFGRKMNRPFALIGRGRARDIALNAVLPLLQLIAEEERDVRLDRRLNRLIQIYPAATDNSLLRKVRSRITTGERHHPMLSSSGVVQQGVIHLDKTWCSPGRCSVCPISGMREDV